MRKRERKKERERDRGGREREREGGREGVLRDTERDREFHAEITSTSAQSEIFKPSHSHIPNYSIYCRYKLTWSPMYCTNKIRQTEMLMVGHKRQDQTGFKLVSNYIQSLSSLIGLPAVMERDFVGA